MKKKYIAQLTMIFTFALVSLVLFQNCGKDSGGNEVNSNLIVASGLNNTWQEQTTGNRIAIADSGAVSSDNCGQRGNIVSITPGSNCPNGAPTCGTGTLTLTASNGGSCIPVGSYTCSYVVWANAGVSYLTFNCGGPSQTFQAI